MICIFLWLGTVKNLQFRLESFGVEKFDQAFPSPFFGKAWILVQDENLIFVLAQSPSTKCIRIRNNRRVVSKCCLNFLKCLFFLSLFRTIFGDRGGGSPFGNFGQAAQQQQEFDFGPKEYQVSLTFQQAARGVNKEMHVSIMDNCPRCTGTGSEPGSRPERCPSCNGEGKIQCTALSIIYVLIRFRLVDFHQCFGSA